VTRNDRAKDYRLHLEKAVGKIEKERAGDN